MQHWGETRLADLQAELMQEMLCFTSAPLGPGPVVRGVLPVPDHKGVARVVVWDGHDVQSSLGYDLPLIDQHGDKNWAPALAAALRRAVRQQPQIPWPQGTLRRDSHGISLVPAEWTKQLLEDGPHFDLTDALHKAVAGVTPEQSADRSGAPRVLGFCLLNERSARLYLTSQKLADLIGVDVSLRDETGAVSVGITALAAALPSLIADGELPYNASDATDPYCSEVFDLTHW